MNNYIVTQIKLFAIHHQKIEHDLERKSHSCIGFFQKCFPTFQTEKLSHADLDERALDALKEFPVEVFVICSIKVEVFVICFIKVKVFEEGNVKNPATLPSYLFSYLTFILASLFFSSLHYFLNFLVDHLDLREPWLSSSSFWNQIW